MKEMKADILGDMVRQARVKQGFKQDQLADVLNQSRISAFENDHCDIHARDLIRILEKIEMPISAFFSGSRHESLELTVGKIIDAAVRSDDALFEEAREEIKNYAPTTVKLLDSMQYVLTCRVKKERMRKTKLYWLVQYFRNLAWYSELDLVVLNNCLVAFEKEDLVQQFDHLQALYDLNPKKIDSISLKSILLNIILKLLADNEAETAKAMRDNLSVPLEYQSLIVTLRLIDAIFMYRAGKAHEAMEAMQETILAISILDFLEVDVFKHLVKTINFEEAINSERARKDYSEYYELMGVLRMKN
ncbi:MAG: helix-turn-helix domain-containing protein [Lactobacillales bacterium]|jgi:transcriptional regulator with XRE-family HTH domain|nr:helix-turn-helix domain-containing protein [Lactobacillales bacterium]